jgi:hypothetical protein
MKKWLDKYQDGRQVVPISDNTSYRKPLVISEEEMFRNRLPQPKYYSFNEDRYADTPGRRALSEADRKAYALKKNVKSAVKGADILTDIMQVGNFIPIPQAQLVGKWGNVLGTGIDAFQGGMDVAEGNYGSAGINFASAFLPKVIENYGYKRDMWNTTPGSYANKIANLGNRSGEYIHLTPYVNQATNPVIMRGVNFNRGLLGTLGAETIIDSRKNGGLVSKNSLNRKVTCSNCGWSWKLSDGGMEPMTCHKCGGDIKMREGGVIKDNRGQWAHPGKVTQIDSPNITMRDVNYPVLGVGADGQEIMMQPGGDYTFNQAPVTEYPMMQGGGGFISNLKKAYVDAYNNYNSRTFPAETLPQRQKAYRTINPSSYLDLRNYGRWVSDEQREESYDPRSEEAFKFYLGLSTPDELKYLKKSKYIPTINAVDKNYYTVDPQLEQDIFNSYKDKVKLKEILQTDESEIETPISGKDGAGLLGRFGVSRGRDKQGDYLSYYDRYDLKDFAQKRTKGMPYSIYNRIYYPKKEQGGEMIDYKSGGQHGGLDRWFAEKWVDIKTGKPCGRQEGEDRNYPACRPSKRISSDTPKTSSELSSSEKERFKQEKTSSQRISYNHNRKEYGGENIDNMNYMKSGGNVPTNPELYSRVKSEAKSKFNSWPSAYGSAWLVKTYKNRGGGYRKAEYGMEVMGNGGVPNNPGFNALPEYVQQNIINNMAVGGQKMPPKLAYARFAAAGNLDQLDRYGYQEGGEEKETYWRTKKPMVNDPSMDAISKVLLQRNQDKNFMQRAAGFGNQNGIPTKYIDGENPNSNDMSTLLMGFGDNYVSPTIIETFSNPLRNNSTMLRTAPGQLIYQPDQRQEYIKTPTEDIADYFAAKGYKRAANDMYGMNYKNGGNVPMYGSGGEPDGEMAIGQIDAAINKLTNLRKFIQPNSDLEPWVSSKLTMVDDYANSVSDYMMYNPETKGMMELPIEEMEYGGISMYGPGGQTKPKMWLQNDVDINYWNNMKKKYPTMIGIDPNHVDKYNNHLPIFANINTFVHPKTNLKRLEMVAPTLINPKIVTRAELLPISPKQTVNLTNLIQPRTYPVDIYDRKGNFIRQEFMGDSEGVVDQNYIGEHHYAPRGGNSFIDTNYAEGGGIPERYRNMGFTSVGAKKQSTRPGKKWMVLAKKGDDYKVVHGGYKGMQDFKQHHSEQRRENFWNRMGGKNSSKATDPFSPLYWHKRFGTWEEGGQTFAIGGQSTLNPIVKKDNKNWLEYLKN